MNRVKTLDAAIQRIEQQRAEAAKAATDRAAELWRVYASMLLELPISKDDEKLTLCLEEIGVNKETIAADRARLSNIESAEAAIAEQPRECVADLRVEQRRLEEALHAIRRRISTINSYDQRGRHSVMRIAEVRRDRPELFKAIDGLKAGSCSLKKE
jgi:hypothetical protein